MMKIVFTNKTAPPTVGKLTVTLFDMIMGKADALQKKWSKQAQKKRTAYLEGGISATEFGEWLDHS